MKEKKTVKRLPLSLILFFTTILCASSGCSLFGVKAVYAPPGSVVEVAYKKQIEVWITNQDTGKKELRTLDVNPGYYIVRPRVELVGVREDPKVPGIPGE